MPYGLCLERSLLNMMHVVNDSIEVMKIGRNINLKHQKIQAHKQSLLYRVCTEEHGSQNSQNKPILVNSWELPKHLGQHHYIQFHGLI